MIYKDYYASLNGFERINAPQELFHQGNFELLYQGKRIAIVGSRKATEDGLRRAKAITSKLVEKDFVIVSGLAKGIDTVAHTTAIQKQGKTIAVVGTPLDSVYPKENTKLFEQIRKEHLAISQFKIGWPTTPKNFPIRNRTMALICDATLIIEAQEKSGTIHQGWEALRLGRQLFIMENIKKKGYSWVDEMESYGAQIINRDNFDVLIDELPNVTEKSLDALSF